MYSPVQEDWAFSQLSSGNWAVHGTHLPLFKGTRRLHEGLSKAFRFRSVPGMRVSQTSARHGIEYDLLLNGLRRWQPYPLRNASLVGSTSHSTASSYGSVWRLILPNDGRIMVAPVHDIWYAFERPLVALGLGGADPVLIRLNEAITSARLYLGLRAATDYADLIRLLEEIASTPVEAIKSLAFTTVSFIKNLQEHKGDLESWMDELLSPLPNGFVMHATNQFIGQPDLVNREVWTDSDCLLIEDGAFHQWRVRSVTNGSP